jgi:hypothetical protein
VNGTLPILSGVNTEFLSGAGTWLVPGLGGGAGSIDLKCGVATGSGNGSTKVFNIPHGLGTTPTVAIVKANSINAFGEFVTTKDATNVTVTYQNAPPSGSSNLSYEWMVMDPEANVNGEINTYSTVGGGATIVKTKDVYDLPFRSFIAGSSKLSITQNANDLTLDVVESNFTTSRPPTSHATSHKSGGSDVIKINELAASTTNNTATNSTTTVNGTLPILSGVATEFLTGSGTWAVPAGAGSTYSTVGTGAAWTKTKVGVDLPFRSFIVGSSKLTLTTNTNDLTLDVNQANLSIAWSQLTSVPSENVQTDQPNTYSDFVQTFPSSTIKVMNPAGTFGTILANSALTGSDKVLTLPLITGADTVAVLSLAQTFLNKTLVTPTIASILNGSATLTLPTSTDTLVGRSTSDTLNNKILVTPTIASILNSGTITLPTATTTLMGRDTTDTATNKTVNLTSNTVTDTGAASGGVPIHTGTRYENRAKGADGTFLGVSGGTVGYYVPPTGSAGLLPDGSTIPATGRWGALYGGTMTGRGIYNMTNTYNAWGTDLVSATETGSYITTAAADDAIAEFQTSGMFSRQSNMVFKAKWALKQAGGSGAQVAIMIGFSSQLALPTGGSHDTPLDSASGIMITCSQDAETNYQVSRNDGDSSQEKVATVVSSKNTTAHTLEIQLNTTNATVILDGNTYGPYTTEIPANTTELYTFMHIESIGSAAKSISCRYMQTIML